MARPPILRNERRVTPSQKSWCRSPRMVSMSGLSNALNSPQNPECCRIPLHIVYTHRAAARFREFLSESELAGQLHPLPWVALPIMGDKIGGLGGHPHLFPTAAR